MCFIHVFHQTLAEQLYRDKGLYAAFLRVVHVVAYNSILHTQMNIYQAKKSERGGAHPVYAFDSQTDSLCYVALTHGVHVM